MGAWIETLTPVTCLTQTLTSRPLWARGLKLQQAFDRSGDGGVAPLVGAWIETLLPVRSSPLTWVAPLVGAWIETSTGGGGGFTAGVAPLVGAWIETRCVDRLHHCGPSSRPLWARGLKHQHPEICQGIDCRAPCGRVD